MVKPPERPNRDVPREGGDQFPNLRSRLDFSQEEMDKREKAVTTDVGESYRQIKRQAERLERGEARVPARRVTPTDTSYERLQKSTQEYLQRTGQVQEEVAPGRAAPPSRAPAAYVRDSYVQSRLEDATRLLQGFESDRVGRDLSKFPYLQELRTEAQRLGVTLSDDDIKNLVSWGQLESAARQYIKLTELGYGDIAEQIPMSLSDPNKGNLVMASMFPTVVEELAKEAIGLDVRDPNTVDTILEKVGSGLGRALDVLMIPGEKVRETSRAMSYGQAIGAGRSIPTILGEVALTNPINSDFYAATSPGKFNQNYINQLVGDPAAGKYTQLEVDLATSIVRKSVLGEAQPIAAAWNEQENRTDPEVAKFFRDVQFGFGPQAARINELMRQIQSVDLSNTAAVTFFDAANPSLQYDPARGQEWYARALGFGEFSVALGSDPLNLIPIPLRAGQAARWTLTKLAPNAVDAMGNPLRAAQVLQKRNLLGFSVHTGASRYFSDFADDLNKLDSLESSARDATSAAERAKFRQESDTLRQRMSRQYDEMPEPLIESFRREMTRNDEGKFDLDTVAKYIDDTNDTFIEMTGGVGTKFKEEAMLEAADLIAIERFLANRPVFVDAVASTTQRRKLLIPRRGPIGVLRVNAVNDIISRVMPTGNARRILEESFDDTLTTAEIAQRLDEKFLEIGREIRKNKGAGRWFSSIPSGLVISLDDVSGAKEFYRFARQYMDRHLASFLTDAFRNGTVGSRRVLVAATVRSGLASRGVIATRSQIDEWMARTTGAPTLPGDGQVTGSAAGEAYALASKEVPSQKLSVFRLTRRARTPEGVQEQLVPAAPAAVATVVEPGQISRIVDESGVERLSVTLDEFLNNDEELNLLLNKMNDLYRADAPIDEVKAVNNQAEARESFLREKYKLEEQLLDIDLEINSMPSYTVKPDGTIDPVAPEDLGEELIENMARSMMDDLEQTGGISIPSPATFESASGVYMTPLESEYFVRYGFLHKDYLERAFKNMESPEKAARINPRPLTKKELEDTPANTVPNGGIEVFNYRLKYPDVNDESGDYIHGGYFETTARTPALEGSIETQAGIGEALSNIARFDPERSIVNYGKTKKRKGKPQLSTEEAIGIREGTLSFEDVYRIVKEEGRSLRPEQAEIIRRRYGIDVRGTSGKKREIARPQGIYIEWAENGTDAGRARLFESYKEDARALLEDQYYEGASFSLNRLPALQEQREEILSVLRARTNQAEPGSITGNPVADAMIREFDDNVAARVDGRLPMEGTPKDPVVSVTEDVARAEQSKFWSPSRDQNDMEEAIHEYQIARSVRIMSIEDIDQIKREASLAGSLRIGWNETLTTVVDAWSFATLFGPRFSVRNAIEELIFYVLTGGKVSDLYKGRRASTAQRQTFPRFTYEKGPDGTQQLVIKTNLGLFNRLSRGYTMTGRLRDDANKEWLAAFMGKYTSKDDFIKAQLAWQAGDPTAYTQLYAKALIHANTGILPTGLSARESEKLLWIAGSQHGQNLVQNAAETGNSILNGRLPNITENVARLQDLAEGEIDAMMKRYPTFGPGIQPREYGPLRPVQVDEYDRRVNGLWAWWRELQAVSQGDGPIGKLAIKYIGDPDTAKKAIADFVRNDETWGYRNNWSMFSEGRDIDEAASRYYENVLRYFQKPTGEINWKLRNLLVDRVDGEDIVNWYKPVKAVQGKFDDLSRAPKVHRLSVDDLNKIKLEDRPEFVFGRLPSYAEPVPVLTGLEGLMTKGYGILGRQNARISREPIFYANYLRMTKELEPAEIAMANGLAKAGGRDVPNEFDRAAAAEFYNRSAADSAYAMTMAYVDNPANRSLLAWRLRNVARYYRATEDFYRRAKRLAINYPESYYRAALVYGLLEDTGFVFEDEEGVKYFYYPGNEYVQKAFTTLSSLMPGVNMTNWQVLNPFQVGGKVVGLSPSLDPKSAFPTMAGPMTFPVAAAFELFPALKELQGLRSLALGTFVQPQSVPQLFVDTVTPAGLKRLQQLDQDQLDSMLQESAYDTIKIMVAEGLIDGEDLGTENGAIGISEFMRSDLWKSAQGVAWGLFATRFLLSWLAPAAPQTFEAGTLTPVAREMGISDVDSTWRALLELNKDEPDPWSSTASMYYAAKMREQSGKPSKYNTWDSLLPFTLSGSKSPTDKLAGLSGIQPTDDVVKWFQTDEYKNLEKLPGGADSVYWLAPRTGEFTWQGWYIIKNQLGLRVPKTVEEKLEELFAAEGQYRDSQIRRSYDEVIASLNPVDPDQRKEINRLEGLKQDERAANERSNPYWNISRSRGGEEFNQTRLAESVKQMEIFIDAVKESGQTMPEGLVAIGDAIRVYRDFRTAMAGLGSKTAEKQQKAELGAEMNRVLAGIGQSSPQAKRFIETVLDTLNYGELTQFDPLAPQEAM